MFIRQVKSWYILVHTHSASSLHDWTSMTNVLPPPLPFSQQQIEKKSTKTERGGGRDLIYVNRKPFSHKAMYKSLLSWFLTTKQAKLSMSGQNSHSSQCTGHSHWYRILYQQKKEESKSFIYNCIFTDHQGILSVNNS